MENKNNLQDVIEYYDKTRFDYRVSWDNSPTPAVHFGYYDEHSKKHTEALMNTNRVLSELAEIKAGEKILDAGCGRGGSSFWLALHKDVEAVGITPVQTQIDDCNEQAKKLQLEEKTSFVLADYCNTDFEDETFDVVWACESLCHAKEKGAFYREAYRLLKPGGRLVIAEYLRARRPLEQAGEEQLMAWLNRWAIDDIDTKSEHTKHMSQAGFLDVKIRDVTKHMKVSLKNLHRNSSNWFWFSWLLKLIGLRNKVQHENMRASMIQYKALEQDLWFYGFLSARK